MLPAWGSRPEFACVGIVHVATVNRGVVHVDHVAHLARYIEEVCRNHGFGVSMVAQVVCDCVESRKMEIKRLKTAMSAKNGIENCGAVVSMLREKVKC